METPSKRSFYSRITSMYRLTVMNNSTFEEKLSLKLTPLGLVILVGSIVIFLIVGAISLIAFSSLREYIPGYADVNVDRKVRALLLRADSLERESNFKTEYLDNINRIISGKDPSQSEVGARDTTARYGHIKLVPSAEDSILRREIETQERYSLSFNSTKAQKSDIADFLDLVAPTMYD